MSIWGKILGATAGLALGGPIGALIGGIAGHYAVDRDEVELDAIEADPRAGTSQIAFTIGVIALGAKMAKADGVVTDDEISAFKQVFQIPPGETKNVARVFNLARQDVAGYELYAQQIARMFRSKPGVLEDLLDGLFHIALADGVVHPKELEFLENVGDIFGFSQREFERIKHSNMGVQKADPYVILGVERSSSDQEIKMAYRLLVKENHPDSLIARGVPEEFVELATSKLASINDAYDIVRKERGFT